MDGEEGKICVIISKIADGFQVKVNGIAGIDLLGSFAAFSEGVKNHVSKVMWLAVMGKILSDLYHDFGEEEYSRLLEIAANHIDDAKSREEKF